MAEENNEGGEQSTEQNMTDQQKAEGMYGASDADSKNDESGMGAESDGEESKTSGESEKDADDKSGDSKESDSKDSKDKSDGQDDKGGEDDDDKSSGAPEQYADFDVPEGFDLTGERLEQFTEYAKSNDLSQEAAQELVNMHTEAFQQYADVQTAQKAEQIQSWYDEVSADKDLGGENLQSTEDAIHLAVDKLSDSPEEAAAAKQLLRETGLGNNIAIVRILNNAAKAFSEDSYGPDGSGPGANPDGGPEAMYPTMQKSA